MPKINPDKYFKDLFARTEDYASGVRQIYASAIDELTLLGITHKTKPGEAFSFDDNAKMQAKANNILRSMHSQVYAVIQGGVKAEWELANIQNDKLVKALFGKDAPEKNHLARYFDRNQKAMDAFMDRAKKEGGLGLSDKIWNYINQQKIELESALDLGIGEGGSASHISRAVRSYLKEPDKLFKRVQITTKDAEGNITKTGQYKLSKAAKAYHPGQGVYRSSYKNAMRLTRTETNMAYHESDHVRWQQLDFVVGYEIKLSNNHPVTDICNDLAGKYPKTFKFVGWHPQCRCYAVAILCSRDEMGVLQDKLLNGEETKDFVSINQVNELPKGYNDWIVANKERAAAAKSVPYFIKNNYVGGDLSKGLIKPLVDPVIELQKKQLEAVKSTASKKLKEATKYDISGSHVDELASVLDSGSISDIKAKIKALNSKIADAKEALKNPFAQPTQSMLEKEFGKQDAGKLLEAFNKHTVKKLTMEPKSYISYLENEINWIKNNTLSKYKTSPRLMEMLTREQSAVKAELAAKDAVLTKTTIQETKSLLEAHSTKKSGILTELKDKFNSLDTNTDLATAIELRKDIQAEINRIDQLSNVKQLRKQIGNKFWSVEQHYTKSELAQVHSLEDLLEGEIIKKGSEIDTISKQLSDVRKQLALKYKESTINIPHLDNLNDAEYKAIREEARKNKEMMKYLEQAKHGLHVGDIEACAITQYTGGYYHSLNRYLRGELGTIEVERKLEYDRFKVVCNRGLEKMPKFEGTVWRGVDYPEELINKYSANMAKGLPVTLDAFTSSSRIKGANFSGSVMLKIQSKTGAIVEDISLHSSEKEILFRAGARFKVLKMEKRGYTGWLIELEEIV